MKRLMFIMMLAITFIPITHIAASNGEMNTEYKPEIISEKAFNKGDYIKQGISIEKNLLHAEKIKDLNINCRASRLKEKLIKRNLPDKKRERLCRLLLLAHGGQ